MSMGPVSPTEVFVPMQRTEAAIAPEAESFSVQSLAPMLDTVMLAGRGSRGERHESILQAAVDGGHVDVMPLYQKFETASIEYLKVQRTEADGSKRSFMLEGSRAYLSPEGHSTWTLAPKFGEDFVDMATRDTAKEVLQPIIDSWNALSDEAKQAYLAQLDVRKAAMARRAERQSVASRFIARLHRAATPSAN